MLLNLLQIVAVPALSLILWPIIAGITVVNEITRALITIYFYVTKSCYQLTSNGTDNTMWSTQLSGRTAVCGLFSKDPQIDIAKEREGFSRAFSRKEPDGSFTYEKLKQILCVKFGYGCIRRDKKIFQIQNHIKIYPDEVIEEAQFTAEILPKLLSNMNSSQPQWEWIIFPKIRRTSTQELNSLRVFRFDHGYMDGACAGLFLAKNLFDKEPSFFVDPRKPVGSAWVHILAKAWAYLHLPLILVQGVASLFITPEKKPFSITDCKGTHTFSGPIEIDLNLVKKAAAKKNTNVLSFLLHNYGHTLQKVLPAGDKDKYSNLSTIDVSLLGAVLPYQSLQPKNQFTFMTATAPFGGSNRGKTASFRPDWTFYFGRVFIEWLGRLPVQIMDALISVGDVSVGLNNIPFLREKGAINGCQIDQLATWGMLCAPLGIDVMAVSYGDSVALTAHSVEDCMSAKGLENFLQSFRNEIHCLACSILGGKDISEIQDHSD